MPVDQMHAPRDLKTRLDKATWIAGEAARRYFGLDGPRQGIEYLTLNMAEVIAKENQAFADILATVRAEGVTHGGE